MMDNSVINQFFNTRLTPAQSEDIPFIGDAYNQSTGQFYDCKSKEVVISKLHVDEDMLHAEVFVKSFDGVVIPPFFDHIVVGVRVSVPKDGPLLQSKDARWTVVPSPELPQVRLVPAGLKVAPYEVKVIEYEIVHSQAFGLYYFSMKRNLPNPMPVYENIQLHEQSLTSKIQSVEKNSRGHLTKVDDDFIAQSYKFLKSLVSLNNNLSSIKLTGWDWVRETVNLVKCNCGVEKQVSNLSCDLIKMSERYSALNDFCEELSDLDIMVVTEISTYRIILKQFKTVFGFLCSLSNVDLKVCKEFIRLRKINEGFFCFVDLDRVNVDPMPHSPVIRRWFEGQYVCLNVIREISNRQKNIASPLGFQQPSHDLPEARALFLFECPGMEWNHCSMGEKPWLCSLCQTYLFWGFDGKLYCLCGGRACTDFSFRCDSESHVNQTFISTDFMFYGPHLKPLPEMNILVLGESGVGKSTWINSIFNYVNCKTLRAAEESLSTNELPVPIPVKFTITDSKLNPHEIKLGHDDNEDLLVGKSATQSCKSYSLLYEDTLLNLIDTPGIGDVRGADTDKRNVEEIIKHIKRSKSPHAMCILFKSNEARNMAMLAMCIKKAKELMHSDLKNNLYFCFTNSRSTFYKPGDTMPMIHELLRSLKIDIKLAERVYCLDNEGFRYLCCKTSRDVEFNVDEVDNFAQSWEKSVAETEKLLQNIKLPKTILQKTWKLLSMN